MPATPLSDMTLLIAEDDPFIARTVSEYGKRRGFRVIHAQSGLEAVAMGKTEKPQVILLDITLPELDGRDVLLELTRAGITEEAVVIFATGRDSQIDRLHGLDLGADDYETKPYQLGTLFNKIESLLRKKGPTQLV